MPLSVSAAENILATTAASEIVQGMTSGVNVGVLNVIPALPNFASNADVENSFKISAVAILRRLTTAKIGYGAATATVAQAILQSTNNIVNFNSVQKDTLTGITPGSNWVFRGTAGLYNVSTLVSLITGPTVDFAEISLWRVAPLSNSDSLEVVLNAAGSINNGSNQTNVMKGDGYIELLDGEGLRIKVRISGTNNSALNTASGTNWIRIHRVSDTPT